MQHILAFYDEDQIYGDRFKRFASSHTNCPFTVYSFHNYKDLKEFSQDHPIELLVGSESKKESVSYGGNKNSIDKYGNYLYKKSDEKISDSSNLLDSIPAKSIIRLSESPLYRSFDGSRDIAEKTEPSIYKYQSGEKIISEIMTVYGKKNIPEIKTHTSSLSKLYIIYSPIGRSGKTTFARSLSKALRKDCKTLYMTLEEVSLADTSINDNICRDTLSEAFYFYKEGKLTEARLQEIIQHSEVFDHILPVRTPEDLTTLDSQELIHFIEHIQSISEADAIVLDTDSIISRVEGLLPLATRIFMPVTEEPSSNVKLDLLESYLSKTQSQDVVNRIVKLIVPEEKHFSDFNNDSKGTEALLNYTSAVIKNYIYN
ncbi:hypothetical protein [Oribacterium sp. WCC10]|uniref:hypothetical protein n=1 Tax=Oribacterium sp. WCC10 TaxID=1855343 RepID=UPI0008F168D3|nr:hypothetical protein [Oribacterium sp. WCC10]SFG34085.1 Cellulose biosynthesis protein BcsQ [Oribacterium sp. WCC10]